jgi:hypothetical protein
MLSSPGWLVNVANHSEDQWKRVANGESLDCAADRVLLIWRRYGGAFLRGPLTPSFLS